MAKVVAINISQKKGEKKIPVEKAIFIENFGIEGDAHAGDWHRQVSLLAEESADKIRAAGMPEIKEGDFAENITTYGIEVSKLPIGTKLKIGETLQEVTQIGKECHQHCAIYHQVGDCVMPREGIFTKVLKGGVVAAGDPIEIVD
ncbi:MOSC domain-containing protein [Clostridium formicaceticum]|uniref:MOSC domain protein n=1 Tax=Clostridium formicaceticum TaxID=1497 RepID=A0AAC9RKK4_9CLOT|nr:MOSC domain-containing protein [Clostridium formicaceticum]AOY76632.1 MOSC domain-containing protein [Clostridium formicaceticum]ARE87055.1 MOSC domain protein [Clostridium formicaceticum]